MTLARINEITLSYDQYGSGETVVLVTGTGAPGRTWRTHQVPALRAAGFRVATLDNRGIAPTDCGPGEFTIEDMAADVAGLIEHLHAGPCRVVGFSLGGIIVQELLVARPELVRQAVLIGAAARTDVLTRAVVTAEAALGDEGVVLPPRYGAVVTAMQNLSPRTLNDQDALRDWLDILELSAVDPASIRPQLGLQLIADRRERNAKIECPCLVIGFADDLVVRPHLCREVADSIPDAIYRELADCGHFGCLERPEAVNSLLLEFFATA
ncbi:hydrolase [Actinoplanes cyaneus]|uniref:Hydrolase n=1 Tax=Actinoplanes cyaneus TaxID=52696 RepID=A0A919IT56_9ACTN|nr:alpha/beta hydrolase [Actinoplanes cyaneus]MCW2144393.1 Pimeloyl-ACP methyl ester carboxylesterase [Actinoplanes cyaneus]GID71244.1 hydrolase [Actinoplanes cyaneus]